MEIKYKLQSTIPGVTVKLTANPLNARVEMTDSAKRELALMIVMNEMFDDVFSAQWNLQTQRNMQDIKEGKDSTTRENYDVEAAKRELKYVTDRWFGKDEDGDGWKGNLASADRWLQDKRVQMWFDEVNTEHAGDCTAVACSCTRCHVEDLLGIDTLPIGKSVARSVASLYWQETATPEQKEEQRKRNEEFSKKYPSQWTPTPEQKAAQEAAWAETRRKALEYYEEHKRLLALQEGKLSE